MQDEQFMRHALMLAKKAEEAGEVPVGAVMVLDNEIIAEGYNQPILSHDPSAHAEMIAIRAAAKKLSNYRLLNTTLYVTLEPCTMCLGAMVHARIKRLVYAASDPKTGVIESAAKLANSTFFNHRLEVSSGILADESAAMLRAFFQSRR
ncbi:MAG: Cytidine/deoxycytidylate deaminase family protein [Gammaproteobacteria bacterium]|jgi:tRNA(adenine34) deaminase|nr:Cytidine/deoxycytidylate deaminase family protein [Gammaproteobacteria bacterium]